MHTTENGFEAAAHQAFDFLGSHSDVRCVESKPDLVRYESPSVYFEVGYSVAHDCEVYARVGRLPLQPAQRLDFGLFLAVADPGAYTPIRRDVPANIAHTEEQIRRVLSHYATGLRRHGLPLLAGDETAYAQARGLRWCPGCPVRGSQDKRIIGVDSFATPRPSLPPAGIRPRNWA